MFDRIARAHRRNGEHRFAIKHTTSELLVTDMDTAEAHRNLHKHAEK